MIFHSSKIYEEKELLTTQLELLSKTNMVDFAMDIFRKLNDDEPPAQFKAKRESVLARLKELNTLCAPLAQLLQDQAKVTELKNNKNYNIDYLRQHLEVRFIQAQPLLRSSDPLALCVNSTRSQLVAWIISTRAPNSSLNAAITRVLQISSITTAH